MTHTSSHNRNVIFDLGNVLIDWNPRYLYRKMFADEAEMEWFLSNICTMTWNSTLDAGMNFATAVAALSEQYPKYAEYIHAYDSRWSEMISGPIDETVAIFKALKDQGTPCYALSNWSDEKFQPTRARYDFLNWFDGLVISGQIGIIKPDPRIYQHLIAKFAVKPETAIFVDDLPRNIAAAREFGMEGITFTSPEDLRKRLVELKVLQ